VGKNREGDESPARARHCDRGALSRVPLGCWPGKAGKNGDPAARRPALRIAEPPVEQAEEKQKTFTMPPRKRHHPEHPAAESSNSRESPSGSGHLTICRFPPAASRWNMMEQQVRAPISISWRRRSMTQLPASPPCDSCLSHALMPSGLDDSQHHTTAWTPPSHPPPGPRDVPPWHAAGYF